MNRTRSLNTSIFTAALLGLFGIPLVAPASEQPQGEPASTTNTGVLRWSVVVEAPVAQLWERFATEDGIESWMAPRAQLDLRIGGTLRTNYNPDAAPDDPTWIVHQILAYEPGRMLTLKTISSPQGFPHADRKSVV